MVVKYELRSGAKMTDEQILEVEKAARKPIVYDDDSPEMTEEMEKAFAEARARKPYNGRKVVLYLSDKSIDVATKKYGENYSVALGSLLEEVLQASV